MQDSNGDLGQTGQPSLNLKLRPPAVALGRPVAHPADKIDYARLLKAPGTSLGQTAAKTGIPKASRHRCLVNTALA